MSGFAMTHSPDTKPETARGVEPRVDAALREKINRAIVVWLDLPGQLNLPRPSTFALAETISKIVEEEANG
jgi:hypothetical protein